MHAPQAPNPGNIKDCSQDYYIDLTPDLSGGHCPLRRKDSGQKYFRDTNECGNVVK
jgi:hypothetical protein